MRSGLRGRDPSTCLFAISLATPGSYEISESRHEGCAGLQTAPMDQFSKTTWAYRDSGQYKQCQRQECCICLRRAMWCGENMLAGSYEQLTTNLVVYWC